jgi:branched-chain amino acid transport system permease protein
MGYATTLVLNGLAFGMLIFLLASGLTLIFGLLRFVNLAHGSVYLLTAYASIDVASETGSFALAVVVAVALGAVLGALVYFLLVRGRPSLQGNPLAQVLVSFGLIYIAADLAQTRWHGLAKTLAVPGFLDGTAQLGDVRVSVYRLALIAVGAIIAVALYTGERRSELGAAVRAGVDDPGMLAAIGVNPERLFAIVFVVGFAIAGLSGALGAAFIGAYPGAEYLVLLYALPVVVVGGVGSLTGAFAVSALIGVGDAFAKAYIPEVSIFAVFAIVVALLTVRPEGLVRHA